jgi:hypothetical protein
MEIPKMSMILDEELRTYEDKKHELLTEFKGKFVLIKGSGILGIFDTQGEAIEEGYGRLGNVPFLTKEISERNMPNGATFIETMFAPSRSMELSTAEDGDAWTQQTAP